jgi:hypothetical protein
VVLESLTELLLNHVGPNLVIKGLHHLVFLELGEMLDVSELTIEDDEMMKAFDDQVWSYMVQEQLGETLENHLFARDEAFSAPCCYKIGL